MDLLLSVPFIPIGHEANDSLLDILTSRLPISAHLYNMAKMRSRFPKDLQFFSMGELGPESWIVTKFKRDDYGNAHCISAPPNSGWTDLIRKSFLVSPIFQWDQPYWLMSVERRISQGLISLSLFDIGNSLRIYPSSIYFYDPKSSEAGPLNERQSEVNGVEVKAVSNEIGRRFIADEWAFYRSGTSAYVDKLLVDGGNESSGVWVDGLPVSGLIWAEHGLLHMLTTLAGHSNKGYGTQCTQALIKSVLDNGFIPASSVETKNVKSHHLHRTKLGMLVSHEADDIMHIGGEFTPKKLPK